MRIYKKCPTPAAAREAWKYFIRKNDEEPKCIWKMPNNFKKNSLEVDGRAWGLWVADYEEWKDYYDPKKPQKLESRNIYEFLGKQTLLDSLTRIFRR